MKFVRRLIVERKELNEKFEKLNAFLTNGKPDNIDQEDWKLLQLQLSYMTSYLSILDDRIQSLRNKNEEIDSFVTNPTPTEGQKAVGISFNPSGDERVNFVKQKVADIIDLLNEQKEERLKNSDSGLSYLTNIFHTQAINCAVMFQMSAVKSITWKDEDHRPK